MDNKNERNLTHGLWDSFEHVLLFFSLYIMMITLSSTLHIFIDHWIPSSLKLQEVSNYLMDFNLSLLRFYVAGLIITYPIFAFLFLNIVKRTRQYPEVRKLKSRKVLTYLTLFFTFLLLIFNAISIVYNFLDGNVSVNFLLHFITTGTVNGLVFVYYLHQIKEDKKVYV
ncbi:hypothetical protein A2954_01740 [Candidatus Roizmanbacteria bacterium RIFCSPLOWO2_01_FULL_37_12]|uniref:DUF5671 domain-containing protein n=1 Tax=Candidatus Roizmanbacteria bacterium RIFCSPLOWO2_01_FULL_37_12 TaxID=1802056 RepID=A0A1F7I9D2_9BACT|nr:MAG: hypothetical protein A2768_01040 [Candidatus Roizmanbacteria bacterium RIFCSPHIGHO2_01_FULL_37_16]OGK23109.1 MAG: hypothetical protein A3D76_05885 [Candidatus Roizmanbacteria bacterium RIFCSPHIGHO2_02_FULL_37_9b]OGK39970.1 MAG: hypothetical protein A2954_01740 [Candidatus Roizmanbacteria bacterium RIFCSPLOWO2_01_FULL_37_12]